MEIVEPPEGGLVAGRRAGSVEQLLARVATGDAIAVVPDGLARERPPGIVAVPLTDALPSEIVVAVPGSEASGAAIAYADAARAVRRATHGPLGVAA